MKSLVIVESPAKARTINKILGKEFGVKASIGHIKDLPKKDVGVDVDHDFAPSYTVIPGKEKVVEELAKEAKKADTIYIATDPDREGEAIAYHIAEVVTPPKGAKPIYRVTFHEITDRVVRDAILHPSAIDMNKVEAQQARRVLDRLVGYNLSPFLWKKVRRGLSAGRVQSVAVRLVVDREREISAFLKEEYWTVDALFRHVPESADAAAAAGGEFRAKLFRYEGSLVVNRDGAEGKRFLIGDEEAARHVVESIRDKEFFLSNVEKKLRKKSPSPPFITSTLQQEAARKHKFPAKKTMAVAQKLYEGVELGAEGSVGLITYMRTDSFRVAPESQKWARDLIEARFGKKFLPPKPPFYRSKETAQEAHEAIRPTYPDKTPDRVKSFLSRDEYNLYTLIWNRFIASQMAPAELEQTTFIIGLREGGNEIEGTELRATGTVIRFPGFMALYTESRDEADDEDKEILPPLDTGVPLDLLDLQPVQHFTQPPPRYSEASLVRTLEEKGIGRPSTYAAILSTIQDRKYVQKEEGRFVPTELGVVVNDLLVDRFPDLLDAGFTAKMENDLDEIENAKRQWVKVVRDFYTPFQSVLAQATQDAGRVKPQDIPTDINCEKCGSPMVVRWGRHGRFLACTGYPKCKNTKPISGNGEKQAEPVMSGETCDKCGAAMLIKTGRFGKFLACSNYPECKSSRPLSTGVKCPQDGGDIVERRSKKGRRFWSCSNYPSCTFSLWSRPLPKACPRCSSPFLIERRDKAGNIVLSCPTKDCRYRETVAEDAPQAT